MRVYVGGGVMGHVGQLGQLLNRIAEKDMDAFEQLYREFVPRVYRYLRVRLQNEDDIHDVVQETFVTVWKNAGQFHGAASPSTWMLGIARHKLLDFYRKSSRLHLHEEQYLEENLHGVLHTLLPDIDTQITLAAVFDKLPEDWKELAYLVFVEELPYKEIAQVLLVPEGTVKSRVFALKSHLKAVIRKEVMEDGAHMYRGPNTPAFVNQSNG